ncbi:MAG TPA: hypothetical protein VF557_17065 [Jatrophihabitans sp.]|uniref:hypothetical protein n=1 Tax=Jatrophihabitans sp. TaxID=1932789 RepID=UPI002EFE9C45
MGIRGSVRVAAAGLGAVAAVALMPAATAHAALPGQVCNVNQNTWVRWTEGGSVRYTIPAGGGFRIDHFNHQETWIYGHGNGQPNGWIPNDGRLYNCHW